MSKGAVVLMLSLELTLLIKNPVWWVDSAPA